MLLRVDGSHGHFVPRFVKTPGELMNGNHLTITQRVRKFFADLKNSHGLI